MAEIPSDKKIILRASSIFICLSLMILREGSLVLTYVMFSLCILYEISCWIDRTRFLPYHVLRQIGAASNLTALAANNWVMPVFGNGKDSVLHKHMELYQMKFPMICDVLWAGSSIGDMVILASAICLLLARFIHPLERLIRMEKCPA